MAELKTQPTGQSAVDYLNSLEDEKKRADSLAILKLMQEVTGEEPVMWGESIIGFGLYRYKYKTGRTGEWFLTGFAPRKRNLALYIMSGMYGEDTHRDLMSKLGKYKTGKSCLYINKLADIDTDTLRELVKASVEHMEATNERRDT